MATDEGIKVAQSKALELQTHFDCVDNWEISRDLGFRILPISGQFLCAHNDAGAFASILKAILPADVKLMLFDGLPIRMSPSSPPIDVYVMIFASAQWPPLPEGVEIPKLQPLIMGKYFDNPVWNTHAVYVPDGVECRLSIDKRTHTLAIPKDEETDDQCVVIVRPKG